VQAETETAIGEGNQVEVNKQSGRMQLRAVLHGLRGCAI